MNVLTEVKRVASKGREGFSSLVKRALGRPWFDTIARGYMKASRAGTHGYPPDTQRRLIVMNLIAYLIAISTLGYAIQHMFMDFETYAPVIYLNLALVFTAIAVPFSHRFSDICGGLIIVVSECAALMAFTYYLGRNSGIHLQYFIGGAAMFVVFGLARWRLVVPLIVLTAVLHLIAWFWFPDEGAIIVPDHNILDSIYVQAALTTVALISAAVYYAFSLAEGAKAETDALLRNILPDKIVERLKAHPTEAVADSFIEASILFADITGFVALARKLGAEKTVALLNRIVMQFDDLAQKHGVEKIKTIGDAYMVASGIPEPKPDHAERLARMGLDMLRVVKEIREDTGLDLNMRVGFASGPVMAGVIGTQKFSYDVWGDPVNLAARLEGLSTPGKILICPGCFEKLSPTFVLEHHDKIDIKGVGLLDTWFLTGETPAAITSVENRATNS